MEKIIQILRGIRPLRYISIGQSKNISETFFLLNTFLRNFKEEVKLGIEEFQNCTLSINDFHIEYGDSEYGDDYYVSFTDDMFDKQCEDENGWVDADCLPRLKLSYENFDHILQTWTRLQEVKPKYLILVKHEDGWLDIWGREKLSEEDQKIVKESESYARNRNKLQQEGVELF